jgi:hypothetical protein
MKISLGIDSIKKKEWKKSSFQAGFEMDSTIIPIYSTKNGIIQQKLDLFNKFEE